MEDTLDVQIIHKFELESVLTYENDTHLWVSVLKKYWINRLDLSNQDLSFYLDVAVTDGESIVGCEQSKIGNWNAGWMGVLNLCGGMNKHQHLFRLKAFPLKYLIGILL